MWSSVQFIGSFIQFHSNSSGGGPTRKEDKDCSSQFWWFVVHLLLSPIHSLPLFISWHLHFHEHLARTSSFATLSIVFHFLRLFFLCYTNAATIVRENGKGSEEERLMAVEGNEISLSSAKVVSDIIVIMTFHFHFPPSLTFLISSSSSSPNTHLYVCIVFDIICRFIWFWLRSSSFLSLSLSSLNLYLILLGINKAGSHFIHLWVIKISFRREGERGAKGGNKSKNKLKKDEAIELLHFRSSMSLGGDIIINVLYVVGPTTIRSKIERKMKGGRRGIKMLEKIERAIKLVSSNLMLFSFDITDQHWRQWQPMAMMVIKIEQKCQV